MDDHVLILTYEYLAMGYLKRHILIHHEVHDDDCVIKMGSSVLDIDNMLIRHDNT